MKESEVKTLLTKVIKHGKIYAKNRLHEDDVESEAGLVVTMALKRQGVTAADHFTYCCRAIEMAINRRIEQEAKYQHMKPEFWSEVQAGRVREAPETPTTRDQVILSMVAAGHTQVEIAESLKSSPSTICRNLKRIKKNARP